MKLLKFGSRGPDVARWENYLAGLGYRTYADGRFDDQDVAATKKWQREHSLVPDGVVGALTLAEAMIDESDVHNRVFDAGLVGEVSNDKNSIYWPPPPKDLKPLTVSRRTQIFGSFEYTVKKSGNIVISGTWVKDNIVPVELDTASGPVELRLHRKIADQFRGLFKAWQGANNIDECILSWDGSFVPRLKRGAGREDEYGLSNHAFGIAVDLNAAFNSLNVVPPRASQPGTVRPLVPLMNKHGFYSGMHFKNRVDGMHCEFAKFV